MKIGKPIDPIVFKSTLKLNVKKEMISTDKKGRLFASPLAQVINIADKYNLGVFIGEDIFIYNADKNIENDLKENNIPYEIMEGENNGKT